MLSRKDNNQRLLQQKNSSNVNEGGKGVLHSNKNDDDNDFVATPSSFAADDGKKCEDDISAIRSTRSFNEDDGENIEGSSSVPNYNSAKQLKERSRRQFIIALRSIHQNVRKY